MNKEDYIKAMNQLKISEDFKEKTAMKIKNPNKGQAKNTVVFKRLAVSAAGLVILVAVSAAALNLPGSKSTEKENNLKVESTLNTGTKEAQGITVPAVEIPTSDNSGVTARMLPLFVYKGHIYIQSATSFETTDGTLNKEDVLALRGDFLGKTKGSIDEWSTQEEYATEFASTIGEGEVYTVKGYDSNHRLMVYYEYQDGNFGCELYDSFGGMTINSGADYFTLLNLQENVAAYQWQSYNSWNNGLNEVQQAADTDALNAFLESLNASVPIGNDADMLLENTDYDSQKFIDIKTNDKLITSLRLVKGGYVYDSQIGFFKVDDKAFQAFWDTMPVSEPAKDTAANEDTEVSNLADFTLADTALPVGSKELKAVIKNNGSEDIFYGADFSIEKLNEGNWETVPAVSELAFIEIAYSAAPGAEEEFTVDLSLLNPALDAGNYRLVKNINGQTFYAEFELK
ncbi:immunoglobulin-like domain-containing protein [Anaerocolumna sp. AGMB13020]|uniref:immunoglobulin-like domain-containing protein n=1 Tax=Anaerocolumna sp. AGMB13020 TaxID=3081750 RepID=UPI0029553567|nr:immunoglobulin-like domain-containing protein [Anaerocolumna sp. AGMB13020]WOO37667.1 immunoglobulin-like domain-containing protein [Anaerocolumna sp. AGMB13020]